MIFNKNYRHDIRFVELKQLQAELDKIEAEVILLGVKTENEMLAPRPTAEGAH